MGKMLGDVIDQIPGDVETFHSEEADDFYSGEGNIGKCFELTIDAGRDILDEVGRSLHNRKITLAYMELVSSKGKVKEPGVAFFMTDKLQEYRKTRGFKVTLLRGTFQAESLSSLVVNAVPHVHIMLKRESLRKIGGHLTSGGGVSLPLRIVPIKGIEVYRAIDEQTKVAHLRFKRTQELERHEDRPRTHVIVTVSPERDFSLALRKVLEKHEVKQGKLVLGLGTLREAKILIQEDTKSRLETLNAEDGYELVSCHGELKEGVPTVYANVIDRKGRHYQGILVNGKVKDLIEFVIRRV